MNNQWQTKPLDILTAGAKSGTHFMGIHKGMDETMTFNCIEHNFQQIHKLNRYP